MRRPNVILIMADDLGYGDAGCYGCETIRTPQIDQLAAEGLTFRDYHANGPVCTPTRAALLTGRYQQRCGLEGVIRVGQRDLGMDPRQAYALPQALREAGYATALLGKWHLGFKPEYHPLRHGFDLFRGYVSGNVDYHSHVDNHGYADWWLNEDQIQEEGYVTDLINAHAVNYIREHRDEPFFLYVAHEAPHWPYQGRGDKADRVAGRRDFPAWGSRQDRVGAYKEMIEVMDEGVGMIRETLKECALDAHTLVIFCSDNGPTEMVGSAGALRGVKGELFEGGHRVPAIARWTGRIAPGTVTDETVLSMDWLPTFLRLGDASMQVPQPLDGIDVSDVLLHQKALPERDTGYHFEDQAALRRGDWKLLRVQGQSMLFNLADDLGEQHDLADAQPERVARMNTDLDAWIADVTAGVVQQV